MGIKGKDFVVVVGDTTAAQQIITIKHDEDKLVPIDSHKLMCLSGTLMKVFYILLAWHCRTPFDIGRVSLQLRTYVLATQCMATHAYVRCLCAGEPGDRVQFSEFIMANARLYALRHERSLTTKAVANFTRSELATALRKVCHSSKASLCCA